MTEPVLISRRKLLATAACGLTALPSLSFLISCGNGDAFVHQKELIATINELGLPAPKISARAAILPLVPNVDEHIIDFFHALSAHNFGDSTTVEQLQILIAQDFSEGDIFYVDGWSMSHTELALCFLREGWS